MAYDVIDERRAAWLGPDGGFDVVRSPTPSPNPNPNPNPDPLPNPNPNQGAYSDSLAKAQAVVVASSLVLYVLLPITGAALLGKALHLV